MTSTTGDIQIAEWENPDSPPAPVAPLGKTRVIRDSVGGKLLFSLDTSPYEGLTPHNYLDMKFVSLTGRTGGVASGTIADPFPTIQEAIDSYGVPVDAADQARNGSIFVEGGVYEEDLVIPARRSIFINAFGGIIQLGTLATPRSVTIDDDVVIAGSGLQLAALQLVITGNVIVTDGGTANSTLVFTSETTRKIDGTGHTTGALFLIIENDLTGDAGVAVDASTALIVRLDNSVVTGTITCGTLARALGTSFFGDITISTASLGGLDVLIQCDFGAITWTGPAGSFRVDAMSNFNAKAAAVALAGGATKTIVGDLTP